MRKMIAALGTALALVLTAGAAAAQEKLKVCFVYVGPHNDGGWSQGHDHARELLQEELGDIGRLPVERLPAGTANHCRRGRAGA